MEVVQDPFNLKPHGTALFHEYAKKLDYDDDKIAVMEEVLDSVKSVLDKHDVRQQSINWDRIGVKLKDGKVVFPPGFTDTLNELIKENQLANLFLPEDLGGMGFTNIMSGPLIQLLAEYDFSLKITALSGMGIMNLLIRYYREEFIEPIKKLGNGDAIGYAAFTEAQAGSNLRAIKSTSELIGDEYVLNGTKLYISNGHGDMGIFLANNIVDGKPQGTNVFLVEGTDGITVERLEEKMGLKASPTAQLLFENVTVPKEHLIGDLGHGYDRVLERLLGMRLAVAFQALGACKRAYELSYNHAVTREQFGKPIIAFPDIQRKLKFMTEQLPKLQEISFNAAFALDLNNRMMDNNYEVTDKNIPNIKVGSNVPNGVKNGLIHYYVSSAKLYCSEISNYLLYDAQQVFGGLGFISEMEVNKIARDCRVLPIFDGTTEIHKWIVNRSYKAISGLENFSTPMSALPDLTTYEKILYTKLPDLVDKL